MEHAKSRNPGELLAIYGADRSRWPAAARDASLRGSMAAEVEAASVDHILDFASKPAVPVGAANRLLERLPGSTSAGVIAFPSRPPNGARFFRYASLPLAASLALGVYLGAQGSLDIALPSAITGVVAQGDDASDDLGGVGELEAYSEDNVT